ncbi:MAG: hypothetical protein ACRYGK_18105 [Janthinobacterium lividum]
MPVQVMAINRFPYKEFYLASAKINWPAHTGDSPHRFGRHAGSRRGAVNGGPSGCTRVQGTVQSKCIDARRADDLLAHPACRANRDRQWFLESNQYSRSRWRHRDAHQCVQGPVGHTSWQWLACKHHRAGQRCAAAAWRKPIHRPAESDSEWTRCKGTKKTEPAAAHPRNAGNAVQRQSWHPEALSFLGDAQILKQSRVLLKLIEAKTRATLQAPARAVQANDAGVHPLTSFVQQQGASAAARLFTTTNTQLGSLVAYLDALHGVTAPLASEPRLLQVVQVDATGQGNPAGNREVSGNEVAKRQVKTSRDINLVTGKRKRVKPGNAASNATTLTASPGNSASLAAPAMALAGEAATIAPALSPPRDRGVLSTQKKTASTMDLWSADTLPTPIDAQYHDLSAVGATAAAQASATLVAQSLLQAEEPHSPAMRPMSPPRQRWGATPSSPDYPATAKKRTEAGSEIGSDAGANRKKSNRDLQPGRETLNALQTPRAGSAAKKRKRPADSGETSLSAETTLHAHKDKRSRIGEKSSATVEKTVSPTPHSRQRRRDTMRLHAPENRD